MDLRKLKTLIDLVADSNIAELEVTEAEGKVRIVKSGPAPTVQMMQAAPVAAQASAPVAAAAAPLAPAPVAATPAETAAAEISSGTVVKSPMVGTFYRSSSPGNPSFVEVGAQVKVGDTLCIIEAMKLLNEIDSEVTGTIKQILVDNGQAVEYGQPLFVVS